jgi:cellulose synthase/poly-beta-1,6-N-acetylglucosamine synthase-like glycosyltransferase
MMTLFLAILFWTTLFWIVYVFIGYPVVMAILARLRPRPIRSDAGYLPSVAFVMAAYNEEKVIAQKIDNYLDLDYPRELLSFHIGSDGSTDATDAIVTEYMRKDPSISLDRFDRCGKTRIIYTLAERVTSDIIIFTDADVVLERSGLRPAMAAFADPDVGGVVCRIIYRDMSRQAGSEGERKYTEIENTLRFNESLFWTTVAPTGPCYAVRPNAYTPLEDYRLSDDTNLSITIPLNGYRVVYEHDFLVFETTKRSIWTEVRRRLRMGQQSTATFLAYDGTRYPWLNLVAFEIWSHKLLRNLAAVPAAILLVSSLLLAGTSPVYTVVAIMNLTWIAILLGGAICEQLKLNFPVLLYPLYFTAMVISLTIGSMRAAFSGGLEMWNSQRLE